MDKREALALEALEEWTDTPEALGEVLATATQELPPPPWRSSSDYESTMALRGRIQAARGILRRMGPACTALLGYELDRLR
jgi:hypothetical protein